MFVVRDGLAQMAASGGKAGSLQLRAPWPSDRDTRHKRTAEIGKLWEFIEEKPF
jgi:hypothetical protein